MNKAFEYCTSLKLVTILNPNCEIGNPYALYHFNGVIHGYCGSTAQTYAEEYGYKFEAIH